MWDFSGEERSPSSKPYGFQPYLATILLDYSSE